MEKVREFLNKWGMVIMLPLVILTFFKSCNTNRYIEESTEILTKEIDTVNFSIKVVNSKIKNPLTEKELKDLIKTTPNWKTLELEELSDKDHIAITKLKNEYEGNNQENTE